MVAQEAEAVNAKVPDADTRLVNLRTEIVGLSRVVRGLDHPKTQTAIEGLVTSLLKGGTEQTHAIELVESLSRSVAFQRPPRCWRTLEFVLRSAGSLRASSLAEDAERISRVTLDWLEGTGAAAENEAFSESAERLRQAGMFHEARSLLETIVAARIERWGEERPETLRAQTAVARLRTAEGDPMGSAQLQERVLRNQPSSAG